MEREEAIRELKKLQGVDLRQLVDKYQITLWKNDHINKGWSGQVLERYLGLPINSAQSPNFGSWELKIVSLKFNKNNELKPKETMQITMIDPYNVTHTEFEKSHLFSKLRKMVVCARMFESKDEKSAILVKVETFDLDDSDLVEQIREDYNLVRETIINKGFEALTGKMGVLVQPRTKGPGHGSTSRAFYARQAFVSRILHI